MGNEITYAGGGIDGQIIPSQRQLQAEASAINERGTWLGRAPGFKIACVLAIGLVVGSAFLEEGDAANALFWSGPGVLGAYTLWLGAAKLHLLFRDDRHANDVEAGIEADAKEEFMKPTN